MTRTEFLLPCQRDPGLGRVFLVPGGQIDPLVAELGKGAGLQPIVAAHEEGAGFMADDYARVSSRFGVCMCIGVPGAGHRAGNSRTAPLTRPSPHEGGEGRVRGQRLGACGFPHKLRGPDLEIVMGDTLHAPDGRKPSWRDAAANRQWRGPARGPRLARSAIGFWVGGGFLGTGGCVLGVCMPYHHPVAVVLSALWWGIYLGCFGASVGALIGLFTERAPAPASPQEERVDCSDHQPDREGRSETMDEPDKYQTLRVLHLGAPKE